MLAEDLGGALVQAAGVAPLGFAAHQVGVVHLAQGVGKPDGTHFGEAHFDVRVAAEEVVQDEGGGELEGGPVAPVHHPLEGVEVPEDPGGSTLYNDPPSTSKGTALAPRRRVGGRPSVPNLIGTGPLHHLASVIGPGVL